MAYNSLKQAREALLGRIACFRSPVKYEALKALAETTPVGTRSTASPESLSRKDGDAVERVPTGSLDTDLGDLVARGLLHHDAKESRFDLHPIVRRYAYDRLAAPDRTAAHTRLRDYFAAVPKPDKVTHLEDLAPVIEVYHHTVRAGQFDEAWTLFRDRLAATLHFQLGAHQLQIDLLRTLFLDGEDRPPRLKLESDQAWMLNSLATSYGINGQPRSAVQVLKLALLYAEKLSEKRNVAVGLANLANRHHDLGALRAAEANLRQNIVLCREIKDESKEGVGHAELGRLLAACGVYAVSETELARALKMFENRKNVQGQGIVWAYRAQRELLRLRTASQSAIRNPQSAIASGRRALERADEDARIDSPVERDYVRAHWLLGAAHRVAGQHDEAERHLHEALERCRRINMVDHEADILIDLARLRAATGAPEESQRLADEALRITERSGYVLQGADAHLELAKLALARGDKATALDHAKEARRLATCDGPPDYTYKAAYDEAGALLAQLGQQP